MSKQYLSYRTIFLYVLLLLCSCTEKPVVPISKSTIQVLHRKYDTNSPYSKNPVLGNQIDKYLNSQNKIIEGDKTRKIIGNKIDFKNSQEIISFNLEKPERINTKGITNISFGVIVRRNNN